MFQKESVLALWYRARTADSRIGIIGGFQLSAILRKPAACLPRIAWIDGCSCLISQGECWVSKSTKSYPASARIDTSTFGAPVVPTTVLPDLMESLMAFIWRRCLPQY